jgi:FixJ family two-component response regulator
MKALRTLVVEDDAPLIQKPFRVTDLERAIQRALATVAASDRVAVRREEDRVLT